MNKMTIIEIQALDNGAHRNQTIFGDLSVPAGWAVVPADMERPTSWPFVDIAGVEDKVYTKTVTYLRDKFEPTEDGQTFHTVEEITEEKEYTIPTVTGMTEREKPEKPEPETPTSPPSVWDELDAAYQEGVNTAYEQ